MSQQKHTPEPWYDNDGYRIYGPSPSGCKGVGSDRPLLGDFKPFDGTPFDSTRAVQCVNACAGLPDPAAEIARLRADLAELRAQHAQDQADREHYMGKLGEALAELTKLRTVYAAAVQECRMARAALGHNTALSLRHDAARAEAGMEAL